MNPKSAILSLVPEYSDSFIPQSLSESLPPLLSGLYKPEHLELPYHKLLEVCEDVYDSLEISAEQCINLEKSTKDQAKSKLWFTSRAGRVTASNFKSAACTDLTRPSQSLIMTVCYPEAYKFTSSATRYVMIELFSLVSLGNIDGVVSTKRKQEQSMNGK